MRDPLRELAEKATPGRWEVDAWEEGLDVRAEHAVAHLAGPMTMADDAEPDVKARALADALLISLAPDLARGYAEMAEALRAHVPRGTFTTGGAGSARMAYTLAALASYEALLARIREQAA